MTCQHHYRRFAGLILVVTVVIVGCSQESPAPGAPEAPKVSVMHPKQRELTNDLAFNGWMQPEKIQEVRARIRGHIKKVDFTDGMIVDKDKLLFEIDTRPFKVALDAATAQVASAEAALNLAKAEFARTSKLATMGAATREEVDVWTGKLGVATAEKAKAETSVEDAKLNLEYCRITADIRGRIGKAMLTEGNLVNAGGSDPLLATIVSTDPIRVYFNVDERALQQYARSVKAEGKNLTEILAVLRDRKAKFTFALEGELEFKHEGTLSFGDNRIDPDTGTIQLYGTLSNEKGFYLAGARVRVRLPSEKASKLLLVPETAILADQDKRYVLIADDKNVVRRRDVALGQLTEDSMRVITPADKLAEGEKPEDWWVITDNLQRARINYPVDPEKPVSK